MLEYFFFWVKIAFEKKNNYIFEIILQKNIIYFNIIFQNRNIINRKNINRKNLNFMILS